MSADEISSTQDADSILGAPDTPLPSESEPKLDQVPTQQNGLPFCAQVFALAKDLETPHLYEDAAVVDEILGRVAVADGVSSAIFSRQWAQIITQELVANPVAIDDELAFNEWLNRCRQTWRAGIDTSKLKFYQRAKMADGAFTTILWCEVLEIDAGQVRHIRAHGLGDTCLFHVRAGTVLTTFPIQNSSEFGLSPHALQSIDRYGTKGVPGFLTAMLRCAPGDLLVLCTDAVAQWAFQCAEAGRPVDWHAYWGMAENDWHHEIVSLREQGAMRVDDCTLVLLQFDDHSLAIPPSSHEASVSEQIGDELTDSPMPASLFLTAESPSPNEGGDCVPAVVEDTSGDSA